MKYVFLDLSSIAILPGVVIYNIADKCFKRLNVLRCVSGTAWGCDKSTLLVLYRAYIRSCMEYGCQAFDNAAPSVLQKLAVVQSSALRVCTGALRSTPVSVLQSACNEPPLFLRRRELMYITASKISSDSDHPASGVIRTTLFSKLVHLNIGRRLVWLLRISVILCSGLSDFAKRSLMSLNGILFLLM